MGGGFDQIYQLAVFKPYFIRLKELSLSLTKPGKSVLLPRIRTGFARLISCAYSKFLRVLLLVVSFVGVAIHSTAFADKGEDQLCRENSAECVMVGAWEASLAVGVGGRTNPIVGQDDQSMILLPSVNFYGKRLFFQTDTLGFTFVDRPNHQFNAILTPSYEQIYFKEISIGNFSFGGSGFSGSAASGGSSFAAGDTASDPVLDDDSVTPSPSPMPTATPAPTPSPTPTVMPTPVPDVGALVSFVDDGDVYFSSSPGILEVTPLENVIDLDDRKAAALFGFEYLAYFDPFSFGMQILRDVSSVHDGYQARTFVSLESKLSERQRIEWLIGGEWRDRKVSDYYFGIDADEILFDELAYESGAGFSPHAKIQWHYHISERWELVLILDHRRFSRQISDSPLVEEDSSTAGFFGGVYHF